MKILGMGFPEILILFMPIIVIGMIVVVIVVAVSSSNKGKRVQRPVTTLQQSQHPTPDASIVAGGGQGSGQAAGGFCTECGTALEPGDRFCPKCGSTKA